MSQSDFYAAQAESVPNPRRAYGIARVIVGTVYVALGAAFFLAWIPTIRLVVSTQGRILAESALASAVSVRAAIAASFLVAGGTILSRSIQDLARTVLLSNAPVNLGTKEWISALSRAELPAYTPDRRDAYGMLWKWFPQRVPLLTLGMRRFVSAGLAVIPHAVLVLIAASLSLGLFEVLPEATLSTWGPYRPGIPFVFLVFYTAGAALFAIAALRSFPKSGFDLSALEFRLTVRGAGDPTHIPNGLLDELDVLRRSERNPNRNLTLGFDMPQGGVSNAGPFRGQVLVETQPAPQEYAAPAHVATVLYAGSALQLLACFWWFGLPQFAYARLPLSGGAELLAFRWIAQLVGASLLTSLGGRMVRGCLEALSVFRFRSAALVLDVHGNFAPSEVRVGRAKTDSIESSNVAVRCNASVTAHAATLLTESRELMGQRHIIGMIIDDQARRIESLVHSWFQEFERRGVTIIGIDPEDKNVGEIIKGNLAIDASRQASRTPPPPPVQLNAPLDSPELPGPDRAGAAGA